jgi:2-C-methyl-D-erythritol 2,4-cyclodiphosphate synthase
MTTEHEDALRRYRVGLGYDSHRFAEKRKLVLGGVTIDYPRGLLGHSDGDVALHALIDALLGAAGLPDIGQQFPPSDPKYKDADSHQLLLEVAKKVYQQGFNVVNVDITIITEEPQIAPYAPMMRKRICGAMDIESEQVAIKGKSNEGMGFVGRGEGIAALAIVLLFRIED